MASSCTESVQDKFPLHKLVWENKVSELEKRLTAKEFPVGGI